MINILPIPGAWYGVALPDGAYAALRTGVDVLTHMGPIPLDHGDNALFLDATNVPHFKFAGQSHGGRGTLEWDNGWSAVGPSFSVNPQIYLPDGRLQIAVGSHQGYRFVDENGVPRTGDETYSDDVRHLGEWTEHDGIVVGLHGYSIELQTNGKRHVLFNLHGDPANPVGANTLKFRKQGVKCAVFWHEKARGRSIAMWFDETDIWQFPEALPDAPQAEPIVRIGRPCHVVWFEHATPPQQPPGHGVIWAFAQAPRPGSVETFFGERLGTFVTVPASMGEPGVAQIEQQAQQSSVPVLAYWDERRWPRWPTLRPQDWLAVQAYRLKTESLAAFEVDINRVLQSAPAGPKLAIVCQCYHQLEPSKQVTDPAPLVPVFARLARNNPRVEMLAVFSDAGRGNTGLAGHEDARPLWAELFAGVTGQPPIFVPPTKPDPPKPKPPDPQPPEPQEPDMPKPSLDQWINQELPVLIAAFRQRYPNTPPGTPDATWGSFQAYRRFVEGWEFDRMLEHERTA